MLTIDRVMGRCSSIRLHDLNLLAIHVCYSISSCCFRWEDVKRFNSSLDTVEANIITKKLW